MLKMLPHKHRVHSLTGRITLDTLHNAFKAVKRNRGAAGLDKQSIKMFEANLEENLLALMRELKSGTYHPVPLRRVYIPKGKGVLRPLGIPAVRCRVAQEVIRALMEPIFAPTFHDSSHGFRRHRSCHTAMGQLVELHQQGYRVVVDADLRGFFDSIPHQLILACTWCQASPYGSEMLATWRVVAEQVGTAAWKRVMLVQYVTPGFYSDHPDRVTKMQELAEAPCQSLAGFLRQNWACVHHQTTELLPQVAVPTLVLAAEHDRLTPVGGMKFLHRQIARSQFVVLPRCGHGFMWEIPEQFNTAVREFLGA